MRVLIVLLLMTTTCFANVKLHRYIDKATGEERGVCYSDKEGNPAIQRSDWLVQEIDYLSKDTHLNKQDEQVKKKAKDKKDARDSKRKDALNKLKALGLTKEEIESIWEQ